MLVVPAEELRQWLHRCAACGLGVCSLTSDYHGCALAVERNLCRTRHGGTRLVRGATERPNDPYVVWPPLEALLATILATVEVEVPRNLCALFLPHWYIFFVSERRFGCRSGLSLFLLTELAQARLARLCRSQLGLRPVAVLRSPPSALPVQLGAEQHLLCPLQRAVSAKLAAGTVPLLI